MRKIKFRIWDKEIKDMIVTSGKDLMIDTREKMYETNDGIVSEITNPDDFVLMQFTGLSDANEKEIYEANGNEVVAKTKLGEICGIRRRVEQGIVTLFGFGISYTTDVHLTFIKKVVSLNNIRKEINISDPDIQFVVRRGKSYNYLFLFNYHNSIKKVVVDGKEINLIPFSCKVFKRKK